jgi:histidinol-phosphatase
VVGVVTAPALARRWWAVRGGGAWTRGPGTSRQLTVSRVGDLQHAFLAYSGVGSWHQSGRGAAFEELSRSVWRTRGFGDFWSHMLVAEGAVDVSAEPEVNLWDLAALQVVVEEAGGRFTDLRGRRRPDGGSVLCTNGLVHEQALEILGGDSDAARERPE